MKNILFKLINPICLNQLYISAIEAQSHIFIKVPNYIAYIQLPHFVNQIQFFNLTSIIFQIFLNPIVPMEINLAQIYNMLREVPERKPPGLTSIDLSHCPSMKEGYDQLSEQKQALFRGIFNENKITVSLANLLPFKERKTNMPVCNKLLSIREMVYRCYDCTSHQAAVLCIKCFENGNHKGHRFIKMPSGGGNCDCGNPDAIRQQGFCTNHIGKAEKIMIDEREELYFYTHMRQIFIWILKLYALTMKKDSELLMLNFIEVLIKLNDESLYYNQLTNNLLFGDTNEMIEHIFVMGVQNHENFIAKRATELFLKMFSLQEFKENIAIAYLKSYNELIGFQKSKFESLFIQVFANNDLVQKVIMKSGLSLDPRNRKYNTESYYSSLIFMGTIKQKSALVFFTPIIKNGGIDFNLMKDIERDVEIACQPVESLFSVIINTENNYYSVAKVVVRLIRNIPEMMELQMLNQYKLIKKYSHKRNKVIIPHHRMLAVLIFVYFQCDIRSIDPLKLREIFKLDEVGLVYFFKELTTTLTCCIGELATSIAHMSFNDYRFNIYLSLYLRGGNKVYLLDQLGMKICATVFEKMSMESQFSETILAQHRLEREKIEIRSELDEAQLAVHRKKHTIFMLKWTNLISLLAETIILDRCEIMLAQELGFDEYPIVEGMVERQLRQIVLNMKEISIDHLETLRTFWFDKSVDKKLMNQMCNFDKSKRKFNAKADLKGIPLRFQFCRSFMMSPQTHLRQSPTLELQITQKIEYFRGIFLPDAFLEKIYESLIDLLQQEQKPQQIKSYRELSLQIRPVYYLFSQKSQVVNSIINNLIELARSQGEEKTVEEINELFAIGKTENKCDQYDKEETQKRRAILKQKKIEKMKNIKNKTNLTKFYTKEMQQQQNNHVANEDTCILCHSNMQQSPLCFLAQVHMSNIIFSQLKLQGLNPYFNCCFHPVHFSCMLTLSAGRDRLNCPLCTSISNFVIPNESYFRNPNAKDQVHAVIERLQQVMTIESGTFGSKDTAFEVSKSFLQLFLSSIAENRKINEKQVRLFRILIQIIKFKYQGYSEEEKDDFQEGIEHFGIQYPKEDANLYNFGLFVDLVFKLLWFEIKNEKISELQLKTLIYDSKNMPKSDVIWFFTIAAPFFNISYDFQSFIEQTEFNPTQKPISQLIHFYEPPKSIKQLLQQRRSEEQICKSGHHICVCVVCEWKGCMDCLQAQSHSTKNHNSQTLFFNLLTGGFYHHYKGNFINIRSFYSNETGQIWLPKYGQEEFFFDRQLYEKMLYAVKGGCLMQFVKQNYENLRVKQNLNAWM